MPGEIAHEQHGGRDSDDRAGGPGSHAALAELAALARVSSQRLSPIPDEIPVEIREFVETLRVLFRALGMSLNRLAAMLHSDPGTVSRYLSGRRIPPPDFIEGVCKAVYEVKGSLVTPEVQGLLREQYLVALRVRDPARYEIQRLTNLLQTAAKEKQRYEITVTALEEAIANRNDKIYALELESRQLRSAGTRAEGLPEEEGEHREYLQETIASLTAEVGYLKDRLLSAQRRAAMAEEKCRELEDQLDSAGAILPGEDHGNSDDSGIAGLHAAIVRHGSDAILVVGDDRRIRYATPSAAEILGDVVVENSLLVNLVAPGTREDVDRVLDLLSNLSAGGRSPVYLLQVQRLDGRAAVIEVRGCDLRADEAVAGLVLTLRDVTEQHQLAEKLTYRASHDALTGLPDRTLFAREAGPALASARSSGRVAGVLFVDLDDFKIVNDTMGHGVGDELLAAVGVRLEATIRATDTAARLGGDEFALLIDDAANAEEVDTFAQRIVAAFTEPFTLSGAKVFTSATVGVATSEDGEDVDELLRHADLALYAAKAAGKRRWRHYHDSLTSGMMQRREMQAALEDAVKNSDFALVYQPIVALDSGEIAGFEALLRWPRPGRGTVPPGEFIPIAEETGLIVPIGDWMLRQALSDMVRWRCGLPPAEPDKPGSLTEGPHISVNVSARQFLDPGFVAGVRRALRRSGLPPSALLLEITESLVLGGNERIRADLAELKDIGVRLAIDDFGTGHSSLAYMLDLPIDVLKIDKRFVTGIGSQRRRHALVEGIIKLAEPLQVEIIAEGIETETERELLAAMGCQFGQGYPLSIPADAGEAERLLWGDANDD